jgi:maltose 6'-phosphate phosphatase
MNEIQLIYARNSISAENGHVTHELEFAVLVKNLAFEKQVSIHWAGNDHVRHTLVASYSCRSGENRELWLARTSYCLITGQQDDTIQFALKYLVLGREYYDNNQNRTYRLPDSAGVVLGSGVLLTHLGYTPVLCPGKNGHPITIAVHNSLEAKKVYLRWTTDNWQTYHQSLCTQQRNHTHDHDRKSLSEKMSISLWTGRIKAQDADTMQYAIGCETANGETWDNNRGSNYTARSARLKVLTLNLHCYQENDQDEKFNEIVRAIDQVDIDIICLQEVGEDYNDGKGDQQTNAARILRHRLRQCGRFYYLYTDWSHIGFDRYREGSAILSRYKLIKRGAAYVSAVTDIHSIHARKVVMGQIDFPGLGLINIFSVHLSWRQDGFRPQFEKLQQWAAEAAKADKIAATLLCGDFNTKAGSQGYMMIADGGKYADQFLQAASPAVFAEVFGNASPGRAASLADDDRIDYVFAKKNSQLHPMAARVLFSDQDYRRVSDHLGYLVDFVPSCGQE